TTDVDLLLRILTVDGTSHDIRVSMPRAATANNTSRTGLFNDLNDALSTALERGGFPGLTSAQGVRTAAVEFGVTDDGALTLTAHDPRIALLTVQDAAELGFDATDSSDGPRGRPDVQVMLRDGSGFTIDLDGAITIGDVLDRLNAARPGKFQAALN